MNVWLGAASCLQPGRPRENPPSTSGTPRATHFACFGMCTVPCITELPAATITEGKESMQNIGIRIYVICKPHASQDNVQALWCNAMYADACPTWPSTSQFLDPAMNRA